MSCLLLINFSPVGDYGNVYTYYSNFTQCLLKIQLILWDVKRQYIFAVVGFSLGSTKERETV